MDNAVPQTSEKPTTSHRRPSLKTEECLINGEKIKVPLALCENKELFHALFSVDTWNSLTEQQKRHLMQFLPNFGAKDIEEKSITLKRLFSGNEFRFGSNPLNDFCEKLNEGYYRTDIVRMQKMIEKARYKEYLKKQRIHYYKLLKHCLITRQKLLDSASELPVGSTLASAPRISSDTNRKRKSETDRISLKKRVKHRYFQELISIRKELGDSSDSSFDENYPEGFVPPPFTKKHRKQICALEESFNAEFDQPVISTLSRPDSLDLSRLVLNVDNPFNMTEDKYKEMLKQYRRHRKNPQPYLKTQKTDKMEGYAPNTKPLKDVKPLRKRKPRAKPAVPKATSQKLAEIKPQLPLLDDNFVKPVENVFGFAEMGQLETKIRIKTEELNAFVANDAKPTNLLPLDGTRNAKEEKAMKEEQDSAVAALLKQEGEETKVNEFMKQEEKSSMLLFDEFGSQDDNTKPSDYLLTPDNYNVALHSVVTNESSFKKDSPKSASLIGRTNISEVENLTFDSLSIDTIAETSFTASTSVPPGITPCGNISTIARISPTVTDLDSMNVMDLVPLNVEDTEPPPSRDKPPPELIHNAHSSFFSLIREIICSTCDHRMDLRNLQKRVDTWYDNAVSPLNNWYTNESWPNLLQNAITFLAGQCPDDLLPSEYVPYVEYKSSLDIYQWIGAGRDSDAKLTLLCETWLKNKDQVAARVVEDECLFPFVLTDEYDFKREQRATSPASSRFPTDWVVKSSSFEERKDFQKQEKIRFANPNTPFTYRIHGYQTVVGPINMNHVQPNNAKVAKGSSLLVENRPHYVTILALVQDAAARLPNGEGTRQEIVTLLKDSQYLSRNVINCILHGAVTYSLERLQLESDPCVKYDNRRKMWIYLHRSRTISDFESVDTCKPRTARKTPVWKLKKDATSCSNAQPIVDGTPVFRCVKEPKTNARPSKLTNAVKCGENKNQKRQATGVIVARTNPNDQSRPSPATAVQTVLSDSNLVQSIETVATGGTSEVGSMMAEIPAVSMNDIGTLSVLDDAHTVINDSKLNTALKIAPKATRPSIIKKPTVKTITPLASTALTVNMATKVTTSESKSILTGTSVLSPNTIVKLINAKNLMTDASKGKNIAQISPQQIVVIKQADEGPKSTDKKHTLMLKQMQPTTNATSTHRVTLPAQHEMSLDRALDAKSNPIISDQISESISKSELLEKHQKQLQQLLAKQQNEWKLENAGAAGKAQFQPKFVTQQCKTLPKQMIVIKPNQIGQMPNADEDKNASPIQKQITPPVVILNKQQFQEQLKNSKHQIIQLSGQQLSTQQIQQMLLKQQQQALKQVGPQLSQQPQQLRQGPQQQQQQAQQMVLMKSASQQLPPQLVVIKQQTQQNQKINQKQQHPQVIQIANSGSIISPIPTADLTKLQTVTTSVPNARIQKIQTTGTSAMIQNTKAASVLGTTATTIAESVNKPSLPTYAVVALGQQSKVFAQNNQNVQILATGSNAINNNQTVVLPTSSGAVTVLQQGAMQQVLLPSNFSTPGMINLKTLQGLKVIPISTQNANPLKGPVITRIMNSNAIRPLVIQEGNPTTISSSSNVTHQ